MKPEEVTAKAQGVKPENICRWVAENLSQLPREKALSPLLEETFSGRWTANVITNWLEDRYRDTNNPGSRKMSTCNLLRAAIKRCE